MQMQQPLEMLPYPSSNEPQATAPQIHVQCFKCFPMRPIALLLKETVWIKPIMPIFILCYCMCFFFFLFSIFWPFFERHLEVPMLGV